MHVQRCRAAAELGIAAPSRLARIRGFDGVHDMVVQLGPPAPTMRSFTNRSGKSLTIAVEFLD
jgi:hypothetical protein